MRVTQPRVHDKRPADEREKFTSNILPPYLRKTKTIEELVPWLYLKGVSTGDFDEALRALLGSNVPGLSASTITRLKAVWAKEYQQWNQRDLTGKRYVYVWADGIHFNVRLEENRTCILVLMGATADGTKELIAVQDGYRESEISWKQLLLDVKERGLAVDPELAVGDGALGFWKALPKVFSKTKTQRCWVHKTANVLNKLPKGDERGRSLISHLKIRKGSEVVRSDLEKPFIHLDAYSHAVTSRVNRRHTRTNAGLHSKRYAATAMPVALF